MKNLALYGAAGFALFSAGLLLSPSLTSNASAEIPAQTAIERGKHLVTLSLCTDCHTPGYLRGAPDMDRFLGGSDVGFDMPGLGSFYGPNLTPDPATGLGNWTAEQIVTAFTTGVRPDGRELAPIMPWHAFSNFPREDAFAIAVFLKSLPPVVNDVPGPFGPNQAPTGLVMKVVAPDSAPQQIAAP
jgi:mono/diheme cytochrome c family protein